MSKLQEKSCSLLPGDDTDLIKFRPLFRISNEQNLANPATHFAARVSRSPLASPCGGVTGSNEKGNGSSFPRC